MCEHLLNGGDDFCVSCIILFFALHFHVDLEFRRSILQRLSHMRCVYVHIISKRTKYLIINLQAYFTHTNIGSIRRLIVALTFYYYQAWNAKQYNILQTTWHGTI